VPEPATASLRMVPPPPPETDGPTEVTRPAPTRHARRSGGVLPWLVGAGVVALVVMIGVIIYLGRPDAPEPSGTDTSRQTDGTGGTGGTADPADPPAADEADMEQFAQDYVRTAATDPAAGFALLTPEYGAESGGLQGYEAFWGTVSNPRIQAIEADASDPGNLTVTYTYRYNRQGQGVLEERVTLLLVLEDDGYRIAGAQTG